MINDKNITKENKKFKEGKIFTIICQKRNQKDLEKNLRQD